MRETRFTLAVATHLLHEAPCSVLVVRPTAERERWPRSIVVGTDGSPAAAAATAVAYALAKRFGAGDERKPADYLLATSKDADLLVLGSRGLHGFAALGSVSERVAHQSKLPRPRGAVGEGRSQQLKVSSLAVRLARAA